MRLRQLDGQFVRREVRREMVSRIRPEVWAVRKDGPWAKEDILEEMDDAVFIVTVDRLDQADGVSFLCPKCFAANCGPMGTHTVICWFTGKVPDNAVPLPGRWNPSPSSRNLETLTFVPGAKSHSVALLSGCMAHFFVTDGGITW
jgi:hypothetical protein